MTAFRILYEDAKWLVVDKPPGRLVIPGRDGPKGDSIREVLEAEREEKIFVVHRLDRETSGVLVFARTAEAHRTLNLAFEAQQISKSYQAIVKGRVDQTLSLDFPLVPARKGLMRVAQPGEEGKPSHTEVLPIEAFETASLVEARPRSGRTHQIRVHLLAAGHPLLVDPQYRQPESISAKDLGRGDSEEAVLTRTPLHCASLTIPEGPTTFESPIPEDFGRVLMMLRG